MNSDDIIVRECADPRETEIGTTTDKTRNAASAAVDMSASGQPKLTDAEVTKFMEHASTFVQAPTFAVMIKMLEDKGNQKGAPSSECASIVREIKAIINKKGSNVLRIEGPDLHPAIHQTIGKGAALDIWLGFGPLDYDFDLMVPDDDFNKAVMSQIYFLMRSSQACWQTFKLQYPTVYARILAVFGDCVEKLKISGMDDNQSSASAADEPTDKLVETPKIAATSEPSAASESAAVIKPTTANPTVPMTMYWDVTYKTRIVVMAAYRGEHGYFRKRPKADPRSASQSKAK